ncbi:MAG: type VI secretion protein [Oscillospiraceae bacterium]
MAQKDDMLKKIRAGNFIENNGKVLRSINILRHQFIGLKDVFLVLVDELGEQEFLDCVNYLSQEGYINLRRVDSKALALLADTVYTDLEALVTSKGIKLLGGVTHDEMVDV